LVEYFELKLNDNQSDDFLRMLSKMTYHFPKKILGSGISLTYKRLIKSYDELRKILRSSKIGPRYSKRDSRIKVIRNGHIR